MTHSFALPRKLITLAIVLPIAAYVGYQLAEPDARSFLLIGALVAVLCLPLLLRWHHPLLIFSWNASMIVFFLPGQPQLWMLMSGLSLMISVLSRLLDKQESRTYVRSMVGPLIFLTLVVVVTAKLTGGIGLRSMGGSSYGGKRYVFFLAAVIGYFALSAQKIPTSKANLYMGLFLLSNITYAMGNLLYVLGPHFWFLYSVFPVGGALYQASADLSGSSMVRLAGLTFVGMGICQFLLFRFGIRGLLSFDKPWRLIGFLVAFFVTLLGGFRSGFLTIALLCVFQFFIEGLHRTRLLMTVLLAIALAAAVVVPFAKKLPLSVQRALAILPIEISPVAKADALVSAQWRIQMWKVLWPDIPKYLFLGKGSSINPKDLYMAAEAVRRGEGESFESSLVAGDYHSGLLSLLIQFGIWGAVGFAWLGIAGLGVLRKNYRYGPPELRQCNTFLLAFFLTQMVCFFIISGSFTDQVWAFTGIVGLSVALNGGLQNANRENELLPEGQNALVRPPYRVAARRFHGRV